MTAVDQVLSATWWPQLLAIKDRYSYAELGERFGVTAGAIKRAFDAKGIEKTPMPKGPRSRRGAPEETPAVPADPLDAFRHVMGTVPDARVAEQAGVGADRVKAYRKEHAIQPYARPLSRAEASPPAPAAAEPAPRGKVVKRRREGAAEAVIEQPAVAPTGLDAFRAELGKVPDHVIAEKAGVQRGVVGAYRRKHNIPAYEGYKFEAGHAPPARREAAPVAKAPAAEPVPAKKAQVPAPRTSKLDAFRHLIGVIPDAEVAAKAGVTAANVRVWRGRHGVAPAARPAKPTPPPVAPPAPPAAPTDTARRTLHRRGPRSAIEPWESLVGRMPDAEIAAKAGVSVSAVLQFRRRRGIAPYAPVEAAPVAAKPVESAPIEPAPIEPAPIEPAPIEPAPVEPAPVEAEPVVPEPISVAPAADEAVELAAPAVVSAWTVKVLVGDETRVFTVVGSDILQAVTRAVGALARVGITGTLKSVKVAGDALE